MIGRSTRTHRARAAHLDALGARFFRTGPLGSGHAMKALNNFVGGTVYVAAEALTVGRHYGLSPSTMIDVMNASTGRSFNTEHVVKDHVITGQYATGFAVGLLSKDVGIAAALAEASGVEAPPSPFQQRWAGRCDLGGGADHSEAHKSWWSSGLVDDDAAEPEDGSS